MFDLFISSASAQTTQTDGPQGLAQFLPFVVIFGIFYFLMIRPQKKKLQEEQAMLTTLGKGDEIYTKSGILGTITGMTEKVVTLEVSEGIKFKVLRSQIGGLASKIFAKETSKEGKK
ncbi:MAG: preprotein translocase subunit YajC [Bacteriovoracaceae bacterium]|jgi:preprotein translocase subunit YajC|nr:preprotein translocase subunit YajC [Bacteriovoracaceae bacterium]